MELYIRVLIPIYCFTVAGNAKPITEISPVDLTVNKTAKKIVKWNKMNMIETGGVRVDLKSLKKPQPPPAISNGDEHSGPVVVATAPAQPPVFQPIIYTYDYKPYFTFSNAKQPPPALPLSLPDKYPLELTSGPIKQYGDNYEYQQLLSQFRQKHPGLLPQSQGEKQPHVPPPQETQPSQFSLPQPSHLPLQQQSHKPQSQHQLPKYDNNAISTVGQPMAVPKTENQLAEYQSSSSAVESNNYPYCSYNRLPKTISNFCHKYDLIFICIDYYLYELILGNINYF